MIKVSLEPTQWVDEDLFNEDGDMSFGHHLEPDLEVEVVSDNPAAEIYKLKQIPNMVRVPAEIGHGPAKTDRYFVPLSSLPDLSKTFGNSIYYKTPSRTLFKFGERGEDTLQAEKEREKASLERIGQVIREEGLLYLNDSPLLSGLRLTSKYIIEKYKKVAAKRAVNTLIVCREEDVLPTYLFMLNEMRARKEGDVPVTETLIKFNQVMLCHTNGMTMEQRDAMYIDLFDASKGIMIVSINTFNTDFDSIASFDFSFMIFSGIINYPEEDLKRVKTICEMHNQTRDGAKILIDTEDVLLKPEKLYDVLASVDLFYVRAYLGDRKTFVKEFTKGGEVFKSSEPRNFEKLRKLLRNILLRETVISCSGPYCGSGTSVTDIGGPAEEHIIEFIPFDPLQEALLKKISSDYRDKRRMVYKRLNETFSLDPGIVYYADFTLYADFLEVVPKNYTSGATKYIIRKVKDILLADEKVLIIARSEASRDYITDKLTKSLRKSSAKYGKVPIVSSPKDLKRATKWYNEANKPIVLILTDEEVKEIVTAEEASSPASVRRSGKRKKLAPGLISPYVIRYADMNTRAVLNKSYEWRTGVKSKVVYSVRCIHLTDEHKNAIYSLEEKRRRAMAVEISELKKLDVKSDNDILQLDSDLAKAFAEALSERKK